MELEKNYQTYLPKNFADDVKEMVNIKVEELWSYHIPFDLHTNYKASFDLFKNKFSKIITDIHVKLAANKSLNEILNEAKLNKFEISYYNVDFTKL